MHCALLLFVSFISAILSDIGDIRISSTYLQYIEINEADLASKKLCLGGDAPLAPQKGNPNLLARESSPDSATVPYLDTVAFQSGRAGAGGAQGAQEAHNGFLFAARNTPGGGHRRLTMVFCSLLETHRAL